MKKLLYSACLLLFFSNVNLAQNYFSENFNYTAGDSLAPTAAANGWITIGTVYTNAIKVTSPGLTFSGYANSGIGNAVTLTTSGQDIYKDATQSITTGNVYASFIATVTATQANGDYFFGLLPTTSTSIFAGRVFAKSSSTAGFFNVAVNKSNETPVYSSTNFALNVPHLFVVKYVFKTGSAADDSVYLYVSPSGVPASEPTATCGGFNAGQPDLAGIGRIALRQGSAGNAPSVIVDGIRLGATWNDAPLPVKYNVFTATAKTGNVLLNWSTASEVNNALYIIERSDDGKNFESIGRVKGAGNSSKVTHYLFTDNSPVRGINFYRLKQVDFDGKSEYSKTVSVSHSLSVAVKPGIETTTPNPFSTELNVGVHVKVGGTAKIELIDMLGKQHYVTTEAFETGNNKVTINTASLPDGIFFVRISQNGETFTQKIIKR